MEITSPSFKNNERFPTKYTCDGEKINPPLEISGTPENTKSLVLIVEDPDAVSGTFTHWIVWNMDPKTTEIKENSVPQNAKEGTTDFEKTGYGNPCPPKNTGNHRYIFTVYAIDKTLDIPVSTTSKNLYTTIKNAILDQAEIIGIYSR